MPLTQFYIASGRTPEQKARLIEKVTDAVVEALGAKRENVWIVINDIPRSDWGIGGTPTGKPGD